MQHLFTKLLAIMWLCLSLTSCGFHLRGPTPLPPPLKNIYVQSSDPYGALAHNIKQFLSMSGASVTDTSAKASTVLDILDEHSSEQLLSVGTTQQTRQYTLTLTVTFQLTDPQGRVLVTPQTVAETQSITIEADQILGGSNEQNNMYQIMRRKIVYRIMNLLASPAVAEAVTQKNVKNIPITPQDANLSF